jgi:hypothetical protein
MYCNPHPRPLNFQGEGGELPPGRYTVAAQLYTCYDGVKYPPLGGVEWQMLGTVEK